MTNFQLGLLTFLLTFITIPAALLAQSNATPNPESLLWQPASSSSAKVLPPVKGDVTSARFDNTGKLIAMSCENAVLVRQTSDGREVRRFPSSNRWCPAVWSPAVNDLAISDTPRSVSVFSADGLLRFRITNLPTDVLRLAWSPSGRQLAIGGWDGMLQLCSVKEQQVTTSLDVGTETVYSLAYSPSGHRLAIRTQDERVFFWDPQTNTFPHQLEKQGLNGSVTFSSRNYAVTSPDRIRVFDAYTNAAVYEVESRFPTGVSWADDGVSLIFAENGGRVVVTGANGRRLLQFRCTTGYVRDLAVSPDSTQIAVVDSNSQVVIWDSSAPAMLKQATLPDLPAEATISGRYSDLLMIHSSPSDRAIFGELNEFGVAPTSGHSGDAYWVYSAPNWYVFANSRIGMHRPRSPLPQPVEMPGDKRRIWLAFPGAI